ncbi:hypothetical protein E2562_010629 [Oryza meyeriana var. granulata]|uniref:Uncharacterized protein n=1 Tax=Oryza meyeriana var. granulata TaxID=110450 RepID=A0A6G1EVY6_9ORYZ|nr:hypothetical protein E2562_010629 [Oryza meyeriana var. granulata]
MAVREIAHGWGSLAQAWECVPLPVWTELRLQYLAMDISTNYVDHFKSRFLEQTGHRCSAFEVLIAKAWQSRTRAARFALDSPVHMCFTMNAHPILSCAPRQVLRQLLLPNGPPTPTPFLAVTCRC